MRAACTTERAAAGGRPSPWRCAVHRPRAAAKTVLWRLTARRRRGEYHMMGNEAPVHLQAARGAQMAWQGAGLLAPRVLNEYTTHRRLARATLELHMRARASIRQH